LKLIGSIATQPLTSLALELIVPRACKPIINVKHSEFEELRQCRLLPVLKSAEALFDFCADNAHIGASGSFRFYLAHDLAHVPNALGTC
jgi:hypothetical protein